MFPKLLMEYNFQLCKDICQSSTGYLPYHCVNFSLQLRKDILLEWPIDMDDGISVSGDTERGWLEILSLYYALRLLLF